MVLKHFVARDSLNCQINSMDPHSINLFHEHYLKKINDIFGAMELHICEITLMQHIRSELTLVLGPRYIITLIILHCDLNQCNKITKKKNIKKSWTPWLCFPRPHFENHCSRFMIFYIFIPFSD